MTKGKNDDGKFEETEEPDPEEVYYAVAERFRRKLETEIARDIRIGGQTFDDRLIEAKRQREVFDINRRHDNEHVRRILRDVLDDVCVELRQRLH